ncbi:MAG: hypothetical protein FK733_05985 [Asgard group archaeon]|nr:hypothetical protein [Asgard group archaeon]
MKKLIVELEPNEIIKKNFQSVLEKVETLELVELLKLDLKQKTKLAIVNFHVKEGFTFEDIDIPSTAETMSIISSHNNRYTCLAKVKVLRAFHGVLAQFDIDIIWDVPIILNNQKMVFSIIADDVNAKKFIEAIKVVGDIIKITFQGTDYSGFNLLHSLTERQKEIVIEAKRSGYYDYPRKLNGDQLAKKLGISKPALIEHLRKAEKRIINFILAGY